MESPATDTAVPRRSSLRDLELVAGLVFAHIVSIAFAVGVILVCTKIADVWVGPSAGWPIVPILIAAIASIWFDTALLLPIWRQRRTPQGWQAQDIYRPWLPWPLQSTLAAWWLAHFFVGIGLAGVVEYVQSTLPALPHEQTNGLELVLPMLAAFGFSFAGNLFLALAAAELTPSAESIRSVWKLRLLWDAFIAISVGMIILARR